MATYITELDVSTDQAEEQHLQSNGFKKININLNQGAGGKTIYLWYKNGPAKPITRVQFTFNDGMASGLIEAGYKKIDKNLNAGTRGDVIYLWYFRGSGEFNTPIVKIDFTTDAEGEANKFKDGWEKSACNLNRHAGGNLIFAWVKREKQTYICNVSATDSYESDDSYYDNGYIRVDENTNRSAGGADVFIWYRQTTDPKRALTDLNISTNDIEYQTLQQQGYTSVSVNLNEKTNGPPVYLWHNNDDSAKPIQAMSLLLNIHAVQVYKKAGVSVIERNLNTGNAGSTEFLCFYRSKA
ncbi:hypothetical protein PO909_015988 [Leuciscus waleckii]